VNFTLPIASSSEAKSGELEKARPKNTGVNELTWVKSRLKGGQSVVFEHMQECLRGTLLVNAVEITCRVEAYRLSGIVQTEEKDFGILMQKACQQIVGVTAGKRREGGSPN
jgi:hypothetical protein